MMQDKTPPQPYKRFSSAQVYACAYEADQIAQTQKRIIAMTKDVPEDELPRRLDAELVRLAGAMIAAGEKRTRETYTAVLAAYLETFQVLGKDMTLEEVQKRLPSGYALSPVRLQKYLADVGIVVS